MALDMSRKAVELASYKRVSTLHRSKYVKFPIPEA